MCTQLYMSFVVQEREAGVFAGASPAVLHWQQMEKGIGKELLRLL